MTLGWNDLDEAAQDEADYFAELDADLDGVFENRRTECEDGEN